MTDPGAGSWFWDALEETRRLDTERTAAYVEELTNRQQMLGNVFEEALRLAANPSADWQPVSSESAAYLAVWEVFGPEVKD